MSDIRKRFEEIKSALDTLIVTDDAFGLEEPSILEINVTNQVRQAWRFNTNAQKVKAFRKWLQQQVTAGVLIPDVKGNPFTATYLESAYKKGALNAYTQVHKADLAPSMDFYLGSQEQFLRSSFNAPTTVQKLELLYTRSFSELDGITKAMDQQMTRVLVTGLSQGYGPRKLASELKKTVTGITRQRALVIARTETIAAHAEGQLDAYTRLGVEEVGILAEWSTAGDDKVCELCAPMEGVVMTVEEARGLIPRHPNCRCMWIPASKTRRDKGQKRTRKQKGVVVRKSVGAERKKGTLKEKRKRSVWAGKELSFFKK